MFKCEHQKNNNIIVLSHMEARDVDCSDGSVFKLVVLYPNYPDRGWVGYVM